ncbi:MAG TPA: hypothetical protein VF006_01530 [Longimicrobium sp.]
MSTSIRQHAAAFRRALEAVAPGSCASALRQFPLGSCGDVTDLLGTYLGEKGAGEFDYILGEKRRPEKRGGYLSHAWLERDGLIVDITADQFPEVSEPVIVTSASPWHRSFSTRRLRPADFRTGGSPEMHLLKEAYARITSLTDAGQLAG